MKRKGESGQALILALILLAIGTIMVIPSLMLTQNALKNSQIITSRAKDFYAADAALEYVMWKLLYTDYVTFFTYDGQSDNVTVDCCGSPVNVTVVMRALASFRGVTLIGNTPIKPTKTVTPNTDPSIPVTYTIKLEQISDNTSGGLDAVYDILPAGFATGDYISGSSRLSVDGGPWQDVIGNPSIQAFGNVRRLRWPDTGSFASPIRDFTGGQVKEIQFQMASSGLGSNRTFYNWVVLKPWNTLSGATAKIVTGNGGTPVGGLIDVAITAVPSFVPPGVSTNVTYTVSITNQQGSTDFIEVIDDYLPPGFSYVGPTSGLTTIAPVLTFGSVNGVERWKLHWQKEQFPQGNDISIAASGSDSTRTLTFKAVTSENVSGSYFNELVVQSRNPIPNEFSDLGLSYVDFNSGYSWNSAAVIVPAYDASSSSGNVTANANLAVTSSGVAITSYQVR